MFGYAHKVDNLIATVDVNGQQIDGPTREVLPIGELEPKFEAFGWQVLRMNGNDVSEVISTLKMAKAHTGKGKPVVILMQTVMGQATFPNSLGASTITNSIMTTTFGAMWTLRWPQKKQKNSIPCSRLRGNSHSNLLNLRWHTNGFTATWVSWPSNPSVIRYSKQGPHSRLPPQIPKRPKKREDWDSSTMDMVATARIAT